MSDLSFIQQLSIEMEAARKARNTPYGLSIDQYGNKAAGTPDASPYLYARGGLFGNCEGGDSVINAMVGPAEGMAGMLEWNGTDEERVFVDAWTSIGETGSEQSAVCGDCITPTYKFCQQHYCFGRFCRQTKELQFDRIGVKANSSIQQRALFGNVTRADGGVAFRQGEVITDIDLIEMKAAAFNLQTKNSQMIWNGNPANNSADGRSYLNYKGFDLLITTGKSDDLTNDLCNGLDSFLLDYGSNNPQSDGALAITRYFTRIVQQLQARARGAGFNWQSADLKIVMTQNNWNCISRVWACAGMDLCSLSNSTSNMNASGDQALARHNEILSRRALNIDGQWYPVVIDDYIVQTTGQPNGICSDIYFIITRINGQTITFGQYQNFQSTFGRADAEMRRLFGGSDIAFTDNGRFAVIKSQQRGCYDIQLLTKPRLVMLAPFLAGRLQNVCCNVLGQPFPDPTGSGGVYELGGGRSAPLPVSTLYGC